MEAGFLMGKRFADAPQFAGECFSIEFMLAQFRGDTQAGQVLLRVHSRGITSGYISFRIKACQAHSLTGATARPGHECRDFKSWSPVGSDIPGTGATGEATDPSPMNPEARYYRILVVR